MDRIGAHYQIDVARSWQRSVLSSDIRRAMGVDLFAHGKLLSIVSRSSCVFAGGCGAAMGMYIVLPSQAFVLSGSPKSNGRRGWHVDAGEAPEILRCQCILIWMMDVKC